jgi:SAM-dependent methyltransferase
MSDKEKASDKEMMNIMSVMIHDLINAHRPSFSDEHKPEVRDACSYPFIPQTHTRLIHTFYALRERLRHVKGWTGNRKDFRNRKFLDAGCGTGNVLVTARACGLAAQFHGIEYFDETFKRAQEWLGVARRNSNAYKVFKDDILTFNKYREYDIIYYYCPFSDGDMQRRFEEYLEDEMKVGAVLIAFLKQSPSICEDNRFERIEGIPTADCVYIKRKKGKRKRSETLSEHAMIVHAPSPEKRKVYAEKYGMK